MGRSFVGVLGFLKYGDSTGQEIQNNTFRQIVFVKYKNNYPESTPKSNMIVKYLMITTG